VGLVLLTRALERSSVMAGAGAGVFAAFIVLGRDQVALLSIYVLVGFVLWHWFAGRGVGARMLASAKPLVAGAVVGLAIVVVPVTLTALLAGISNRPEIGFDMAGRGSLHPGSPADAGIRRRLRRVRLPRATSGRRRRFSGTPRSATPTCSRRRTRARSISAHWRRLRSSGLGSCAA
jgi:hypothetical protein